MATFVLTRETTLEIEASNLDIAVQIANSYKQDEEGVVEMINTDHWHENTDDGKRASVL